MIVMIGSVAVDSGAIWIGDPVVGAGGSMLDMSGDGPLYADEYETAGVAARIGDGSFPVFAELDEDGHVVRVFIDLRNEESA